MGINNNIVHRIRMNATSLSIIIGKMEVCYKIYSFIFLFFVDGRTDHLTDLLRGGGFTTSQKCSGNIRQITMRSKFEIPNLFFILVIEILQRCRHPAKIPDNTRSVGL